MPHRKGHNDPSAPNLRLLADIGATHARFALQRRGRGSYAYRVLRTKNFGGPGEAIAAYLDGTHGRGSLISTAALAVAAPVAGDRVAFTNAPWSFSINRLRRALGFGELLVLNDLEALAWALPALTGAHLRKIGGGRARPGTPRAVFGPGTGLGVACYLPGSDMAESDARAIATEGGHMSLAAETPREAALIGALRDKFGHVSAERVLSGPGLRSIYEGLAALDGVTLEEAPRPALIARRARAGTDPIAKETVTLFSAFAGAFAGDLALGFGALGGVYIAGGIVPRLGPLFDTRLFRRRFVAKGRYKDWLARVPTYLIRHPRPALVGLARHLDARDEAG